MNRLFNWVMTFLCVAALATAQIPAPGSGGGGGGSSTGISNDTNTCAGSPTSCAVTISNLNLTSANYKTAIIACVNGAGSDIGAIYPIGAFTGGPPYTTVTPTFTIATTTGAVCTVNSNGGAGTAGTNGIDGAGYSPATSSTTNTIGIAPLTFATQTGLAYQVNSRVRATATIGNYVEGLVTSYTSGSGSLVLNVDTIGGSGSFSSWAINVAGQPGAGAGNPSTTNAIVGNGTGGLLPASGTGTNCLLVNGNNVTCAGGAISGLTINTLTKASSSTTIADSSFTDNGLIAGTTLPFTAKSITSGDGTTSGVECFGGLTSGNSVCWAVSDTTGTSIAYVLPSANGAANQVMMDNGVTTCPTLAAGAPSVCHAVIWVGSTGTANFVRSASPTFTGTPVLATPTATSWNGLTITTSTGTLTIPNGVVMTGPAASGTVMALNQANVGTAAQTIDMSAATGTNALKVPVKASAIATANGAITYDVTNNMLHAAQSAADAMIPQFTAIPSANNNCVKWVISGSQYKLGDQGVPCGSGGGSIACTDLPALTGDTTTTAGTCATTTSAVNGVAYPTSPGTNTVPVVTSTNTITYEALPNSALANTTITISGTPCTLGGTCSPAGGTTQSFYDGVEATSVSSASTMSFSLANVTGPRSINRFESTVLAANTTITFTNIPTSGGAVFYVPLKQNGTGGFTASFTSPATGVICQISPIANITTTIPFQVRSDLAVVQVGTCGDDETSVSRAQEVSAPAIAPPSGFGAAFFSSADHNSEYQPTGTTTANVMVTPKTAVTNNFVTAIAAAGTVSVAQPAFSNLSGSATCSQLPALTGDTTTTAGTCGTTTSRINGTTVPTSATVLGTNGSAQPVAQTLQGNGAKVQLSTGTTSTNHCVQFDANGNTVDAGATCGSGSGGGGIAGWSVLPVTSFTVSATQYAPWVGGGLTSTTESSVQNKAPATATISGLNCAINAAFGAGASAVFTLMDGGSPTSATCTIASGGTAGTSSGSANITAGDLMDIKIVTTGTVTNATPQIIASFAAGTSGVGVTQVICGTTLTGGTITTTGTCAVDATKIVQKFFGTAAPGSVAGNLPGDTFSDTTNHNDYWCNATAGTASPACTTVSAGGWTLLNGGGGGTTFTGDGVVFNNSASSGSIVATQATMAAYSALMNPTSSVATPIASPMPMIPLCSGQSGSTNSVSETNLVACTIPGGLMGVKGAIYMDFTFQHTGTTNTFTPVIRHNTTSAATTGGTLYLSTSSASTNGTYREFFTIRNQNSASSQASPSAALGIGNGAGSTSPITGTINTASASYINFNCSTSSTGDTCLLLDYKVFFVPAL